MHTWKSQKWTLVSHVNWRVGHSPFIFNEVGSVFPEGISAVHIRCTCSSWRCNSFHSLYLDSSQCRPLPFKGFLSCPSPWYWFCPASLESVWVSSPKGRISFQTFYSLSCPLLISSKGYQQWFLPADYFKIIPDKCLGNKAIPTKRWVVHCFFVGFWFFFFYFSFFITLETMARQNKIFLLLRFLSSHKFSRTPTFACTYCTGVS